MRGFAESKSVVTDDKSQVNGDVLPFFRSVPSAVDAEQYVTTIPDADPFVVLLAFETPARAERRVLSSADEADVARG